MYTQKPQSKRDAQFTRQNNRNKKKKRNAFLKPDLSNKLISKQLRKWNSFQWTLATGRKITLYLPWHFFLSDRESSAGFALLSVSLSQVALHDLHRHKRMKRPFKASLTKELCPYNQAGQEGFRGRSSSWCFLNSSCKIHCELALPTGLWKWRYLGVQAHAPIKCLLDILMWACTPGAGCFDGLLHIGHDWSRLGLPNWWPMMS